MNNHKLWRSQIYVGLIFENTLDIDVAAVGMLTKPYPKYLIPQEVLSTLTENTYYYHKLNLDAACVEELEIDWLD